MLRPKELQQTTPRSVFTHFAYQVHAQLVADSVCTVYQVLDDEPRSMLLSLISQLRIGMDLSKVTLPVFVLEVRITAAACSSYSY